MSYSTLLRFPTSILNNDPNSNLGRLIGLIATEIEEFSNALKTFVSIYSIIENSELMLDQIGKLVREQRLNRSDVTYRKFIGIAIRKYLSRGDLKSISEIGAQLIEGSGSLRSIEELAYLDSEAFLDGKERLDGLWPLNGSEARPATIRITFVGSPNSLEVSPDFNSAIADIRAGGTKSEIVYQFQISFDSFLKKFTRAILLDGTWDFSGKSLLSVPNVLPNVIEIALGTGAEPGGVLRPPLETDVGLQNEILRKPAEILSLDVDRWEVGVRLFPGDAGGQKINEMALYDDDGQLVALASFQGKEKDLYSMFNFTVAEG